MNKVIKFLKENDFKLVDRNYDFLNCRHLIFRPVVNEKRDYTKTIQIMKKATHCTIWVLENEKRIFKSFFEPNATIKEMIGAFLENQKIHG